MEREELIERARVAFVEAWEGVNDNVPSAERAPGARSRAGIEAALAVFEEAHAPTEGHAYRGNRSQDTCWVMVDGEMCRKPIEEHAPTDDEREAIAQVILPTFDQLASAVYGDGPYSEAESALEAADLLLAAGFRRSEVPEPSAEHPSHSGHKFGGGYARAAALEAGDPDWMNATGGEPQGEPTAETTHRGTFGHVWPCPLFYVGNWKRGDEEYYPVQECSNPAVCEVEPQGEPEWQMCGALPAEGVVKEAGHWSRCIKTAGHANDHMTDQDYCGKTGHWPQGEPSDAQVVNALTAYNQAIRGSSIHSYATEDAMRAALRAAGGVR